MTRDPLEVLYAACNASTEPEREAVRIYFEACAAATTNDLQRITEAERRADLLLREARGDA